MIRLDGVSKRYGRFTAVHPLDLHVPPGELFGFLGPNGAGKTTTIRMLVGVLRPTAGRIHIAGHDLLPTRRSKHRPHRTAVIHETDGRGSQSQNGLRAVTGRGEEAAEPGC
jgi:ABC-2 type transport system ATP-binding protein